MNLLTQNSKMKKTSLKNNAKIFNFSIPAYKTKSGKVTCRPAAPGVSSFDGDAGQHFFKFLLGFGYFHLQ